MKLVVLSFDEPFFIPDLFFPLIKFKSKDIEAVIIIPAKTLDKSFQKFILEQIEIMGISNFIKNGLKYVHKLTLTKLGISLRSLEALAKKNNIKIYKMSSVNNKATYRLLKKINPDIVISQVPEKIEPEVLKTAKIGFINKHASILPKYRGLNPVFWALLNGEKEMGFTFHFMNDKLDMGNIIFQKKIKINKSRSVFSIYHQIFTEAGLELINVLNNIKTIKPKSVIGKGSYYGNPKKKDLQKFKQKGFNFS